MNQEPSDEEMGYSTPCKRDGLIYKLRIAIDQYEAKLRELIFERDDHKCSACEKFCNPEQLDYANVNNEFPSLENSVTVCSSCKSRVLKKTVVDGKHKIMLRYRLTNKAAKEFNAEHAPDMNARIKEMGLQQWN